jgi:calcineurin-like phosphoesterase family protein
MFGKKFNKEEIFITSDLHDGHINICSGTTKWDSGFRNFKNPQEMRKTLVDNINSVVPKDAYLISLGDIKFGDRRELQNLLSEINCKNIIHLAGNHCQFLRKKSEYQKLFKWFGDYLEIYVGNQLICLNHYAFEVWNESHRGSWMLYGHSHSSLPDNLNRKKIDVGVDAEYSMFRNQLVMTTNYDLQPLVDEHDNNFKLDMNTYDDWPNRQILHHRFFPFNYTELENIMSKKNNKHLDHHNRKDQQ